MFLIIPLARVIPRPVRRYRHGTGAPAGVTDDTAQMQQSPQDVNTPRTVPMRVLGELNRGCRTFGALQKRTGVSPTELEGALEELERDGLMHVRHKNGLFGTRIELYPTDEGFKRFYS